MGTTNRDDLKMVPRVPFQGKNIQILVLDRQLASDMTLDVPYAVISIQSPDQNDPDTEIAYSDKRHAILRMRFDGLEGLPEGYSGSRFQLFSSNQAKDIVKFLNKELPFIQGIIVHCEEGKNRSAAVACAISSWVNGDGQWFEDNYYPVKRVCELLNTAIEWYGDAITENVADQSN